VKLLFGAVCACDESEKWDNQTLSKTAVGVEGALTACLAQRWYLMATSMKVGCLHTLSVDDTDGVDVTLRSVI